MTEEAPGRGRGWILILGVVVVVAVGVLVWTVLSSRSQRATVERLRGEASILRRIGNLDEASRVLEEALGLAPDDRQLTLQLAAVHEGRRAPERAEAVLREALARHPDDLLIVAPLASLLLDADRVDEASTLLSPLLEQARALPDAEDRTRVLVLAGRVTAAAGDVDAALDLLEAATDGATGDEQRAGALAALAAVLADAGRDEEALGRYREALELLPRHVPVASELARILDRRGDRDEAIAVLERVALGQGDDEVELDAIQPLAGLLIRAGRHDDALTLAARVAADPPGRAAAAFIRGAVALERGDAARAESEFGSLARALPTAAWPRVLVARAARRRRALDRAREALEAALAIQPGVAEAEIGLLELDLEASNTEALRARAERLLDREDLRAPALRILLASHGRGLDPAVALEAVQALHRRFPDELLVRIALAMALIRAGDSERAISELSRLVEERPDLPQVFRMLAATQERHADTLEAIEELARRAESDPRFAPARLVLASTYQRIGRADLASRELDRAIEERPDLLEARVQRARLAMAALDLDRASRELEEVRRRAPDLLDVLPRLAEVRLAAREPERAIELLEEAVGRAPANAALRARLGWALAQAERTEDALVRFDEARALAPGLIEAHHDGALLLARGSLPEAREALRRGLDATGDPRFGAALAIAIALHGDASEAIAPLREWRVQHPTQAEGVIAHAMLLALAGDARAATEVARSAVDAPPEVRRAAAAVRGGAGGAIDAQARLSLELFGLGVLGWTGEIRARARQIGAERSAGVLLAWWAARAYGRRGDPQVRVSLAQRVAELSPSDVTAQLELAGALWAAGDRDGHLAALRGAVQRFPDEPRAALGLGMGLHERGNREAALEQYRRAVSFDPPPPIALNNLAYLLEDESGRIAEAVAMARRAAASAPGRGELLDTLGWLLFKDGQLDEAELTLARAVTISPQHGTIRYHLARVLDAKGHSRRAANHLDVGLLSGGRFPEAEEARSLRQDLGRELAAEQAIAAGPVEAIPMAAEVALTASSDEAAIAVRRLDPTPEPTTVRLRWRSDIDGASLAITRDGRTWKRIEADAGQEIVLPRLALPEAGGVITARARDASGPGAAIGRLTLDPAPASALAPEPDDATVAASTVPLGGELVGAFDGASDRDHARLDIPAGARVNATVTAGRRAELRVVVLAVDDGIERKVKLARVPAGATVTLPGLVGPDRGALVLRIAPGSSLAAPAGDGPPAGAGEDWRVTLAAEDPTAAQDDAEPNDRVADARPIETGDRAEPVTGRVGPGDPTDWWRVEAARGSLVSVTLTAELPDGAADEAAPLAFELWETGARGALPLRRHLVNGPRVSIARWRVPEEGELVLAVVSPHWSNASVGYAIEVSSVEAPEPGTGETEPNDRPSAAEELAPGSTFVGNLDVAADRDWFRIPASVTGRPVSIAFRSDRKALLAAVTIFSGTIEDLRFVAGFDASGGFLDIPAIELPSGPALVVVTALAETPAPYEIEISPATDVESGAEAELEPNDDIARAGTLAVGRLVGGVLSGRADRDIVRVDGRQALVVRATGGGPIAVQVLGAGTVPIVVEPGASTTLSPARLGRREAALVEVFAPAVEGAAGMERALEHVRAGMRWELRSEGSPR